MKKQPWTHSLGNHDAMPFKLAEPTCFVSSCFKGFHSFLSQYKGGKARLYHCNQACLGKRSEDFVFGPGVRTNVRPRPKLLAAKSDDAASAFQKRESLVALQSLPLAERAERAVLNHGKDGFRFCTQHPNLAHMAVLLEQKHNRLLTTVLYETYMKLVEGFPGFFGMQNWWSAGGDFHASGTRR